MRDHLSDRMLAWIEVIVEFKISTIFIVNIKMNFSSSCLRNCDLFILTTNEESMRKGSRFLVNTSLWFW